MTVQSSRKLGELEWLSLQEASPAAGTRDEEGVEL